jgi:hypothetical protein
VENTETVHKDRLRLAAQAVRHSQRLWSCAAYPSVTGEHSRALFRHGLPVMEMLRISLSGPPNRRKHLERYATFFEFL